MTSVADNPVARIKGRNGAGVGDVAKGHRRGKQAGSISSAPALDVASPSIVSSSDPDDAGARLSALGLEDSPSINRRSPPQAHSGLGNLKFTKHVRNCTTGSPKFQLGEKPSGDVFLSPSKGIQQGPEELSVAAPKHGGCRPEALINDEDGGTPSRALRYRSSNLSGRYRIGGVDAQGVYPPSACVFVANLPEPKDDRSLEAAVTREFSKYGTVFVKIRRDIHHMPFAFCQYTKDEDARTAMVEGKGAMIYGRACRTEMVKANRTFTIQKRQRGAIAIEEAREALEPLGPMNKLEFLHPQLQEMLGLPPTIVVEFAMFDPSRDVQAAFRRNDEYRVDAFDLKKHAQPSRNDVDETFLNQYDVDRRSIFVGGLLPHVDEYELRELFEEVGQVLNVQVVKKTTNAPAPRIFGFVEFERPDVPEHAIQRFNNMNYAGAKLRVERKVIKEHTPRRVRSQFLATSYTSPASNAMSGNPVSFDTPTNMPGGSTLASSTPKTPEAQNLVSPARQAAFGHTNSMAATPTPSWNWTYPPVVNSTNYMGAPASPYGGQHGHGAVPISPQATPGAISPYAYYGGFWPGMTYVQDPMAATMAYYATYNSPGATAGVRQGEAEVATPTHGSDSKESHEPGEQA